MQRWRWQVTPLGREVDDGADRSRLLALFELVQLSVRIVRGRRLAPLYTIATKRECPMLEGEGESNKTWLVKT